MSGLTYDTGALHARALQRGQRPVVPAGALAQAWRGGPQAQLSRLLCGCRIEGLDERRARAAGVACARSGVADVVDASVVVSALERHDIVVTSDPDDLERLARGLGRRLDTHRI